MSLSLRDGMKRLYQTEYPVRLKMNAPQHPIANAEVVRPDRPFVSEIPKLRKIIASEGLSGLANDTKWNELITAMRNAQDKGWSPDFRFRCVDSEWISGWDGEWWHHLPFPFISVRWLDLRIIEKTHRGQLLSPEIVGHSEDIENLLSDIGFAYEMGEQVIRIFGYAPRDRTDFTPKEQNKSCEATGDNVPS